ncbi:mobile mystery protein B [Namhaeicola litoreus]|uniref:Mobile mystery protein B n=1 Tax=Namhaeicola litoreus TaxID=1052145 RepID=A0ABW3Y015_9FLAO
MGLNLDYIDGQTPIDEDEKEGLRIETISTKGELDEFEQLNIEEAMQWMVGKKFVPSTIFTEKFICDIHRRMFGKVWTWAGKFRDTNKNLGVDKHLIPVQLKMLCDDTLYWIDHTSYPPDEIAIRFKHRLVSIHCFPNGNGRHSRLMADIIIEKLFNKTVFSWGTKDLSQSGQARALYLKAVKQADLGNYIPLIEFARS